MITATYTGQGEWAYPRVGVFRNGTTYEITPAEARSLSAWPRLFELHFDATDLEAPPNKIGFLGNVDVHSGYGGGSISILRALSLVGIEAAVDTGLGLKNQELPAEVRAQLVTRPWFPSHQLIHSTPDYFDRSTAKVRIGWSMWETSKIPDGTTSNTGGKPPFGNWAAQINTFSEHLIVPSKHSKDVFEACGVLVPVSVVPYGLDTDIWEYRKREFPDDGVFNVGVLGDLTSRKSPWETIEAFQAAFPLERYPKVRLHLKTYRGAFGLGKFGIPKNIPDPRITIYDEDWSRAKVLSFLHGMHCFIWLSKGEGFGLPPVQAALTGCPVVTTYNTGQAEWFDGRYFYGVDTSHLEPAPLTGEWAVPNIEHAATQLQAIYNDYAKATKKAKSAADQIRKRFNLEVFGQRIYDVLGGLV